MGCRAGWVYRDDAIGARAGTLIPTSLPAGIPGGSGLLRGQSGMVDGKGSALGSGLYKCHCLHTL